MSNITVITVACALGALLAQSSFAEGATRDTPAGAVVPVSILPPAPAERQGDAAVTPSAPRQNARPDAHSTVQPSSAEREIGTASDGGYLYYDGERR